MQRYYINELKVNSIHYSDPVHTHALRSLVTYSTAERKRVPASLVMFYLINTNLINYLLVLELIYMCWIILFAVCFLFIAVYMFKRLEHHPLNLMDKCVFSTQCYLCHLHIQNRCLTDYYMLFGNFSNKNIFLVHT